MYIYGRGVKGLEAYFFLRGCGEEIEYMIDNDRKKQGKVLQNLNCISYEEFLKIGNRNTKIIVSPQKNKEIVDDLQKDGFKNIELWSNHIINIDFDNFKLNDADLAQHFLDKIKSPDNPMGNIPLIKDLIKDMRFRDGREKDPGS